MWRKTASQQCDAYQPKERAEVAQVLRVIIDPPRPEKNLQVSQQVPDDEQHQNHAGERDDHFLADGGAIKRG